MHTGDAAVEVRGLTKRFGSQVAVDGVSFDVPAGRVVGFLGPNGAGKSTTLRMMCGLTRPSAGAATILGSLYHELETPARTVGTIVDGVDFHPGRRAEQELRIHAAAAGVDRERCAQVLEQVGLTDARRKRVGKYSLGMRQRLGLAAALLGDPRVLLLDEPANGLDPEGIHWVRRLLRTLADEGRTILVSSHLLGEVARLADDVIVIRNGRIVASSSVAELTAAAGGGAVQVSSRDDPALAARLRELGAEVEIAGPAGLIVRRLDPDQVGAAALEAGVVLRDLRPVAAELEDVFLELTGGGGIA